LRELKFPQQKDQGTGKGEDKSFEAGSATNKRPRPFFLGGGVALRVTRAVQHIGMERDSLLRPIPDRRGETNRVSARIPSTCARQSLETRKKELNNERLRRVRIREGRGAFKLTCNRGDDPNVEKRGNLKGGQACHRGMSMLVNESLPGSNSKKKGRGGGARP